MLIWKMAVVRSPAQAHSFGRIYDQGMTASQPSGVGSTAAQAVVA
jgi:hypothetical protein